MRERILFAATLLLAVAVAVALPAPAAAECKFVNGHSATQILPPAGPLCTTGHVIGGLQGRLDLAVSTLEATPPDPTVPTILRFVG